MTWPHPMLNRRSTKCGDWLEATRQFLSMKHEHPSVMTNFYYFFSPVFIIFEHSFRVRVKMLESNTISQLTSREAILYNQEYVCYFRNKITVNKALYELNW